MRMNHADISVVTAKNGSPTLLVRREGKEQYLHSKSNPEREQDRFRARLKESPAELVIVLGLGLGYHFPEDLSAPGSAKRVVVIERIKNILSYPVTERVRNMIESGKLLLLSGEDEERVAAFFKETDPVINYASLSVVRHQSSFRIFNEYYTAIEKVVKAVLDTQSVNKATIQTFALPFFKNALKHMSAIESYRSLASLDGVCTGLDLLVASSSPSLALFLDEIRNKQAQLVILAVDSAVPVLMDYGIRIDYIISVDPQPWIQEHLFGKDPKARGIITPLVSYPVSTTLPVYAALTSHPLLQLVDALYPGRYPFLSSSSGSVSGDALSIAATMKPNRIYLAGMDFCFAHNVMYSRGTEYQNRYDFIKRNRLMPKEQYNASYMFTKTRKRKGPWVTRSNFLAYQTAVESLIHTIDIPVFYVSEEGETGGPENCSRTDSIQVSGSNVIDLQEAPYDTGVSSRYILQRLTDRELLDSLIMHAEVPEKYSQKLLTIINNMLINV